MIAFDDSLTCMGKPLSQGLLKASPEDFLVVEDLGFAPDMAKASMCWCVF